MVLDVLFDLLHDVNKGMEENIRELFIEEQFSISTMIIIGHIKREPGITISQIARETGNAKSHVSKIIEELYQKGWVDKCSEPNDQRILRIYLKEEANIQMKRIRSIIKARIEQVVSGISESRIDEMVEGLKQIKEAMEKLN